NASDVDGLSDGSYFSVSAQPGVGSASIDPTTGGWRFTPPNADWFGSTSFTVTVTDDLGGTTEQVISVTLANVDDAAVISGDTAFNGNEGAVVSGDLNASDVDGLSDGSYFSVSAQPGVGSASIDPTTGGWRFTPPNADWFGSTSFTVTVTDDLGGTTEQVVSITLANVNDPTLITGDTSYTGLEGDRARGQVNISDADGITSYIVTGASRHGIVTFSATTGEWSYRSQNPDWFGTDLFSFTVIDSLGNRTQQTIVITLAAVDDPAVIGGDTGFKGVVGNNAEGQLIARDIDGLSDGSYFSVAAGPAEGQVQINPETGAWRFLPPEEGWIGSVSFRVAVTDDLGGVTEQLISVQLAPEPVTPGGGEGESGGEGSGGPDEGGPDEGEEGVKPVPEEEEGAVKPAPETTAEKLATSRIPDISIINAPFDSVTSVDRSPVMPDPLQAKFIDLRNLDMPSPEQPEVDILAIQPLLKNDDFTRELDDLRHEINADAEADRNDFTLSKETVVGVTFSVSAVLLSGVLRAGSLLACFVSILPLWKSFDPLPILNAYSRHTDAQEPDTEADDSQLETLFDRPEEPERRVN
ncbi:MAG: cadherin-like domain-containing protein, partial [Amphritea sp.]|nr:cadherin-like domain-containing protein [Amphritea sp.]